MNTELTWKDRFDRMKRHYGMTNMNIAEITGMTEGSIRTVVTSSIRQFPRWLKLAIVIFEKENGYLKAN